MFALASRGPRSMGRAVAVLVCLGVGVAPPLSSPARGQERVLDLREFPLDLAVRYLEHVGIPFEVDGDFPDPSARIVVAQEMVTVPRAVARTPVLRLFTGPRPGPEPEIVEVPVEVIREVPVEVPVEVVREVPVEVVREVPVEVPSGGSRGVGWPLAAGLAVAAGVLSFVACRGLGRSPAHPEDDRVERAREGEARDEAAREEGGLPEFRAVIVDEAIASDAQGPTEEVDS